MPLCPECRSEFEATRKGKVFCSLVCKDRFHNREKMSGLRLEPENYAYVKSVADAMGKGIGEQLNIMVNRLRDPDGQQENYDAIYGTSIPAAPQLSGNARVSR